MSLVDSSDVDGLFLFACAVLGLLMQVGFAMLEIGMVSSKNCKSVLLKNLLNLCIVVFWWWLFGYTIATGPHDSNHFLGKADSAVEGTNYVGMAGLDDGVPMVHWFFKMIFAANAVTIVCASLTERTQLHVYFILTTCMTIWIYPVVAYWVWSDNGWLRQAGDDVSSAC